MKRDGRIWYANMVAAAVIEWERIPDAQPIAIPGEVAAESVRGGGGI